MSILWWWGNDDIFRRPTIYFWPIVKMCLTFMYTFLLLLIFDTCPSCVHYERVFIMFPVSELKWKPSHLIMNRCRYIFNITETNWIIFCWTVEIIAGSLKYSFSGIRLVPTARRMAFALFKFPFFLPINHWMFIE